MTNDIHTPKPDAIRALGRAIEAAAQNESKKMVALGRAFTDAMTAAHGSAKTRDS